MELGTCEAGVESRQGEWLGVHSHTCIRGSAGSGPGHRAAGAAGAPLTLGSAYFGSFIRTNSLRR